MIDLTDSPIIKIENDGYATNFREYKGKLYYCKRSMTNYELITSYIAQLLGIECLNYEAAIINDNLYILSENFISEEIIFKDGYDIINEYMKFHKLNGIPDEKFNNLNTLSKILNEKYGIDSYDIIKNLTDIFSFDLLIGYSDRQSPNWGIIEKNEKATLAPMYDGKWSFNCDNPRLLISKDDINKSLDTIILHFLNTATPTSINNFERYYKIITLDLLKTIILQVSKLYSINYNQRKILKNFINRKDIIKNSLKKNKY